MPPWRLIAVVCLLSALGCATWRRTPELPGRNRVVRDQLVIHSDSELPRYHRLLDELTAQRADVSRTLDLPVSDDPIHVYLFDTAAGYNDFIRNTFPGLPTRRAFFIESETRLSVYTYWGDRVAEDLRHEVSHAYLHAVVPNLPMWLDEGLAEYFELPHGSHGLNRPHLDILSRKRADGTWRPNLKRLETLRKTGDMTQLDYAESWAWVHMALETTSQRRRFLHDYLDRLRQQGTAPGLSTLLPQVDNDPQQALTEHLRSLE